MVFSSMLFLTLFLPVVLIGYWIVNKLPVQFRNAWLLIASLMFYGWSGTQYLLLIVSSIIINWLLGLVVGESFSRRKLFVVLDIVFNLLLLVFFKYFNFFVDTINSILALLKISAIDVPLIPLPIGISFFTFQIMSYVVDVYRGECKPQRNLFYVALYITLFPQLIAGPIVRYVDIAAEIENRSSNYDDFYYGMKRFIVGLAKKVLLSNELAVIADYVFTNKESQTMPIAWIGILCYTLQIYFDFSGYSDMAIALGRIFGFHFLENFNYPYISKSIQEFWRRWHISLSSWFRDYVYIPLGGNRRGNARTYANLLTVFFLTGLWHGSDWNFIVWGLYHGIFQLIERNKKVKNCLNKLPGIILHVYTIIVVMIGWVFFRADKLEDALCYIRNMFSFNMDLAIMPNEFCALNYIVIILVSILFCTPIVPWAKREVYDKKSDRTKKLLQILELFLLYLVLILSIAKLASGDFNPFIYFRF